MARSVIAFPNGLAPFEASALASGYLALTEKVDRAASEYGKLLRVRARLGLIQAHTEVSVPTEIRLLDEVIVTLAGLTADIDSSTVDSASEGPA